MSGTIYLETAEYSVGERDGFVTITIRRDGDTSSAVNATFLTTAPSNADAATDGDDFTGVSGTIGIPAGEDSVSFTIPILNDTRSEATERFAVSLIDVDSGQLWFPRTANVSILDDENPVRDPVDPPLSTPYDVSATTVVDGLTRPMKVLWLPGETDRILVAEKDGVIKHVDMTTGQEDVLLDIRAKVNDDVDRGLMDIAFHPDLENNPYVYAFYVVDPPETASNTGNAGQDGMGNRFSHVVRWDIDLSGDVPVIDAASETILLGGAGRTLADISGGGALNHTDPAHENERASDVDPDNPGEFIQDYLKVDARSHVGGALAFGPDGMLYVSVGDGTSYDYPDPRTKYVQDPDSLSGKILRVDPLTGDGLADNPFADPDNLDSNASKVYQLGLRNPFRMAFSDDGELFISETGWFTWEEVNSGPAGANFGWPYFEGGDGGELLRAPEYEREPEAAAFYTAVAAGDIVVTAPYRAFSHNSSDPGYQMSAIAGGESVYTGDRYPAVFQNDWFFTDVVDGEIYTVDTNDRTQTQYLMTNTGGVAVNFLQGPDGYMYFTDYITGTIKRIEITDPNTPPSLENQIADQSATEDTEFTFVLPAGTFDDADGDTLTLTATLANGDPLPGWLDFDPATATFSGTPGAGDAGAVEVKVTAGDGNGGEAFDAFVIEIGSGVTNAAPEVANAIAAQSVAEEGALAFAVPANTFTDADGDDLSLAATLAGGEALPGWLDFDAGTATFSGSPDDAEVGDLDIRVIATDPDGASVAADFALSVTPVNDAPWVAAPLAAQTALVGTETVFAAAAAFADRDDAALTYSAKLSNGAPLPDAIVLDPATGVFTVNAAGGDAGTHAIAVTATDAAGAATTDVFALTVAEPNAAPVLALPLASLEAERGVAASFTLPAGSFADADGDDLTLTARLANGDPLPAWIVFENGSFTIDAPAGAADSLAITVTASDGNTAVSDSFLLTVSGEIADPNAAPELANAIGARGVDEEQAFSFVLPANIFTDADGDTLSLGAALVSGGDLPDWLDFDAATGTFSGTPDDGDVGDLDIRVTATDPSGESAAADFTLTVAPVNDAPHVATPIGDQTGIAGAAFSFVLPAATFADVDDATLAVAATLETGDPLPDWLNFDPATGTFSGTPEAGDAGAINIRVRALDDDGASASDVFSLTVGAGNTPPEPANAIGARDATEEQTFSFILPADTFTDADGDDLTLSAMLASGEALPGWLSFDPATGLFAGTPDDAEVGDLDIRVLATDPSGASAAADFTLVVAPVNDDPTLVTALDDQDATSGEAFGFTVPTGSFADVDDAALTLAATLDGGDPLPGWLRFDPATGSFSGTPGAGDIGSLNITVTATDDDGASAADTFALAVAESGPDETLHQETAENQFLTGESARDVFVLTGASGDYNWGPTEDGQGVVIWTDSGFDILMGFEALRFTNRQVEVSTIIGDDPVRYDDPDGTQFLAGRTEADRFVIDAPSTDYNWGPTQSGEGVVVWRVAGGEGFDILTDFEYLQFTDIEVDISGIGQV